VILRQLPPGSVLARMTVTRANVANLCANVRALARLGLERIAYLPDYLAGWDEVSLALWRREHQRLATWMIGARAAGRRLPDLPAWRAIEARLLRKRRRRRCGAGIEQMTVAPNGDVYPCFRFLYAANGGAWRLGDVQRGFQATERLAQLGSLDGDHLRPERRACADCPARDGCTHYCPALGFLAAGDIAHVPEIACRLMEAQVASVRLLVARSRSTAKARPASPGWAAAALLAATITGAAGCGEGSVAQPPTPDAGLPGDVGVQINLDLAPDLRPAVDTGAIDEDNSSVDADEPDVWVPVGGTCY
jgi:radical SAM protein with 4Fe4S-binding SPASM domain